MKADSPSVLGLPWIEEDVTSRDIVADHCCHELLSAVVKDVMSCHSIFLTLFGPEYFLIACCGEDGSWILCVMLKWKIVFRAGCRCGSIS